MLDLNAFQHLPQLDTLFDEITHADPGLIVVAGFEARPHLERDAVSSGRGSVFAILARQIFSADAHTRAAVVSEHKEGQLRLSARASDRVKLFSPNGEEEYVAALGRALNLGYPLVFAEKFSSECVADALQAAKRGRRIVTQMDTPLAGAWVARELRDAGQEDASLEGLRAVIAVRRLPMLCPECKQPDGEFYRAAGCEKCNGTRRRGEVSIFDVWRAEANRNPLETPSVLSFESYAFELARQGLLAQEDAQNLDMMLLYRTFHLLTASEKYTVDTTQALKSQVTELQVASRTHEQQYLASFALQQVGHKLLELDSVEELGAYICRRAHDLCGADRAVLYLLHHDQTAEIVALNGWDAHWLGQRVRFEDLFRASDVGEGHLPYAGYPPGIPTRTADQEGAYVRAGLRVPLVAQREVVGAMIFHSTIRKNFDARDGALLHALANAGAAAIQRADLIDSLREKIEQLEAAQQQIVQKERLERELELARTVQQNMLPHQFPLVPGAQFYARNEPARQVGGDFYDVFLLDVNQVGVVIADVSDKGMPAALFMALTRSLVRAEAQREASPERVLRRVHRLLLDLAEPTQFVTLFYGVLDLQTRSMTFVRAGHDYPLLVRADEVITLRGVGTVLGILEEQELILDEQHIQLQRGDRLVLYTDGMTDAFDKNEEFFGRQGMERVSRKYFSAPLEKMGDALFDAVTLHQGEAERFDDMTLLIVGLT